MDKKNTENNFIELNNNFIEEKREEIYAKNRINYKVFFLILFLTLLIPSVLVIIMVSSIELEQKEITIFITAMIYALFALLLPKYIDDKLKDFIIGNKIKKHFEFKNIDSQKAWETSPDKKFEIFVKKINYNKFVVYDKNSLDTDYDYINIVDKDDIEYCLYNILKGKHITAKELENCLNEYKEINGQANEQN